MLAHVNATVSALRSPYFVEVAETAPAELSAKPSATTVTARRRRFIPEHSERDRHASQDSSSPLAVLPFPRVEMLLGRLRRRVDRLERSLEFEHVRIVPDLLGEGGYCLRECFDVGSDLLGGGVSQLVEAVLVHTARVEEGRRDEHTGSQQRHAKVVALV